MGGEHPNIASWPSLLLVEKPLAKLSPVVYGM